MALDQGHTVEARTRILPVVDGVTRLRGEVQRTGHDPRHLALGATSSAVTLPIPFPGGTDQSILAARLSRHPFAVEARIGAPS